MSKHDKYINGVFDNYVIKENEEKKVEGYDSDVYEEMKRFEDEMVENADLYDIFEAVNLVLRKPCYSPIQSMTPALDVNGGMVKIYGVTKDNCPNNEDLLKQYVKDLQEATESKLKFKAFIDEEELDGLKKFQMHLTVSRKPVGDE